MPLLEPLRSFKRSGRVWLAGSTDTGAFLALAGFLAALFLAAAFLPSLAAACLAAAFSFLAAALAAFRLAAACLRVTLGSSEGTGAAFLLLRFLGASSVASATP